VSRRFGIPAGDHEPTLTYGGYLQVGHLVKLQALQSDPPQHDELLFIIIHQVYELWFKQLLHELDAVLGRLGDDQALGAHRLLRRCFEIQRVLIEQITVLETMTPNDFLTFRDRLMPASGFQSAQFRAIEFLCGRRDERHLRMFDEGSDEHAMLRARMEGPTLGDAYFDLLRRRGFELPGTAGADEPTRRREHEARLRALARLYMAPDEHYDLYLLTEAMLEFDASFHLWRLRHIVMVERMIGAKPGTGGSEGVAYLASTLKGKFFPELWEVRSQLGLWPQGEGEGEGETAGQGQGEGEV
jgi:tryptophan 2,3-dioxygenase